VARVFRHKIIQELEVFLYFIGVFRGKEIKFPFLQARGLHSFQDRLKTLFHLGFTIIRAPGSKHFQGWSSSIGWQNPSVPALERIEEFKLFECFLPSCWPTFNGIRRDLEKLCFCLYVHLFILLFGD
tara:strand:+ start:245 stop:625 length:381 start_codon:yes stop_codon:yes gene_type:complete